MAMGGDGRLDSHSLPRSVPNLVVYLGVVRMFFLDPVPAFDIVEAHREGLDILGGSPKMLWTNRIWLLLSKEELTFWVFNGYSNPILAGPQTLPRAPSYLLHVSGPPARHHYLRWPDRPEGSKVGFRVSEPCEAEAMINKAMI